MRVLLGCFLSVLLTGCASFNSYTEPKTGSQPLATVSGSSYRNGLFDWNTNMVTSVDDKQIGMVWSEDSKINVIPGSHSFVISSQFNRGFGTGPYSSITELRATLKPGTSYRFTSKPQGASLKVWAEDDHGQRISNIASSNYQYAPPVPTFTTVIVN